MNNDTLTKQEMTTRPMKTPNCWMAGIIEIALAKKATAVVIEV